MIVCEYNHVIWTINPKTKVKKKLSPFYWDDSPVWSPDGKSVIFVAVKVSLQIFFV